jgi:predicted type IV restriction endonuclease
LREIIDVLKRQDGEAPKKTIEEIIYENHRDKFNDDYFKKILPCGVIRWKHFIAWEKQRATIMGLIKRKEESGRGIWKLTQKGWNYK